MRPISETKGIEKLRSIREELRAEIVAAYEQNARPCADCGTPGACCLDVHFVNVRISRLEASAIRRAVDELSPGSRSAVDERIAAAITEHGLENAEDGSAVTYACPLYERGTGCLVHLTAKPLPCIMHACYDSAADLPPDTLLTEAEAKVFQLNRRVYGRPESLLPIPLAIKGLGRGPL